MQMQYLQIQQARERDLKYGKMMKEENNDDEL